MSDLPVEPVPSTAVLDRLSGRKLQALLERLREATYDPDDLDQFMAMAMHYAPRSRAQLFQDLWAFWVCGQKRGGYFVEIGAADGVSLSNTYLLEKEMGWRGLLAEPHPGFAASLRQHRSCVISSRCVYSASGLGLEFLAAKQGEFSRLAAIAPDDGHEEAKRAETEAITVQTISLNDLLAETGAPAQIDFLSIDTEGSEFEILAAFDFDRWRIRAVAVEHNHTPARDKLHDLLSGKGYRRMWSEMSRWDDWYVRD